jgi:hypothetical protein
MVPLFVNDELERMWDEVAVTYYCALHRATLTPLRDGHAGRSDMVPPLTALFQVEPQRDSRQ